MEGFLNIYILSPSNIENEEVREYICANPLDDERALQEYYSTSSSIRLIFRIALATMEGF